MLCTPYHKELIRQKIKTATRRDWLKPRVRIEGGQCKGFYPIKLNYHELNRDCDTWIKILKLYMQALGEMTEEDAMKEGGYTLEYFKTDVWPKASGKPWDDNLFVHVVEFYYVDKCPVCGRELCFCGDPPVVHCSLSTCGWSAR